MRIILFLILVCFTATSVFSQSSVQPVKQSVEHSGATVVKEDMKQKQETSKKIIYTCPMHSEVVQDKSGKCPTCKMNLVKNEVIKTVYTCTLHSEVVEDKLGKCPKCKMNLVRKETAKKM